MSVSVVLPYMFRSLSLTILRGCSRCNATLRLVVVTKTTKRSVALQQEQALRILTETCRLEQRTDILIFYRGDYVFNVYFKLHCLSWVLNNV